MKVFLGVLLMLVIGTNPLIFDFNKSSGIEGWKVVDDGVMGGTSSGNFYLSPKGHGVFEGNVSLENNGGFSSVRYNFSRKEIKEYSAISIRLKGDSKRYQFRLKANSGDYYSYISYFQTSGEWQNIEIDLKDLYPSFRGRKLDQPNFGDDHIEKIAFLIANKREEKFSLLLDKIALKKSM
jgi:NADH dehydrogenase [ubiquinone] 1 alpha subcomplex assembly factor 1